MLRFFRSSGVGQFVVGAIVFTIILIFALEFRAGRGPTAGFEKQCAVQYRGECIDQKDYFASFGLLVPRGVDAAAVKRLGLRKKVLEGLVERTLLVLEARSLGLDVGEEAIDAELEAGRAHVTLPAKEEAELSVMLGLCPLLDQNGPCAPGAERGVRQLRVRRTPTEPFDYKLYEREIRILANRGPREFKEMQKEELLAARLRNLVRTRVRLSPAEADFIAQRAVVRSVQLSRSWFAKYGVDKSQGAVDRWAFENATQVDSAWTSEKPNYLPNCPLLREIVVELPATAFDDEKSPSRQKIEKARARVAAGESFANVAREISDGTSAEFDGELGCLSKSYGIGADELLKAVESLKPGEPSPVIETPRGYHVVELIGRLEPSKTDQLGRRQVALTLYTRFSAEEAARKFAMDLIDRVKAGAKLEDAVRELTDGLLSKQPAPAVVRAGLKPKESAGEAPAFLAVDRPKFEISAPFGRSGNPLPDVDPKEPIASRAFELLKPDAVYEKPIETQTGFVVLQLKELARPDEREKVEVERTLRQMKGDEAVARYVADLRRAAGDKLKIDPSFAEDRALSSDNE